MIPFYPVIFVQISVSTVIWFHKISSTLFPGSRFPGLRIQEMNSQDIYQLLHDKLSFFKQIKLAWRLEVGVTTSGPEDLAGSFSCL